MARPKQQKHRNAKTKKGSKADRSAIDTEGFSINKNNNDTEPDISPRP